MLTRRSDARTQLPEPGRKPMGFREWISKLRRREDAAAVQRAKERASDESVSEKEIYSGDVEGRAAAARRYGRTDRLGE
jgi:hypothetical protein